MDELFWQPADDVFTEDLTQKILLVVLLVLLEPIGFSCIVSTLNFTNVNLACFLDGDFTIESIGCYYVEIEE